jgi:PIN domain nuclease of toxin-antitoxin system
VILVDTHIVVWLTMDQERLSKRAGAAIAAARLEEGGVAIADVTLWELGMLITRGRIKPPHSLATFLRRVEETFLVFPITSATAEVSMQFSNHYSNDPTDRIIGATAVVEGISLVTADEKIRASREVTTVW